MHPISHLWLTVYLGKLDFLSVTDFSLANLRRGNFIVWGLDMSSLPRSRCVVSIVTQRNGEEHCVTILKNGSLARETRISIEFPLTANPKRNLGKNEIPRLLANRRSSAKVLMPELTL